MDGPVVQERGRACPRRYIVRGGAAGQWRPPEQEPVGCVVAVEVGLDDGDA
jgi:hypothetical protein